ncbi:MAG TPA: TetR/AcrR family transcriptional regulator C-terminal domain-containing protein, partial [Blastocatellia bacterium]|nr:TetR/AcrR family transcriptional regulator C-terminal domain-containing protein [Blastocatellia bacterium]
SELYAAIMDNKAKSPPAQQMQILLHEAMEAGDDRRVFESLAFRILEFHDQDEMAMRILLYSALEGHELAEMIYRNHIAKTHRQLTEYVEKRIKQGIFRQMNAKTAVRCFIGMIINQVMFKKFFQRYDSESMTLTNQQAAEQFTNLFLTSMTALSPQPRAKK